VSRLARRTAARIRAVIEEMIVARIRKNAKVMNQRGASKPMSPIGGRNRQYAARSESGTTRRAGQNPASHALKTTARVKKKKLSHRSNSRDTALAANAAVNRARAST